MFRDGCVCFLVLALFSRVVVGQYTLTGPSSAPDGSTVTFTCTISPVPFAFQWSETSGSNTESYVYFYNSAEGRCQRSTGAPPSDYIFDCNSTGVFSLSFPADYRRHSGSVLQCRNPAGPGESNIITLSVTVPLTSVTLLNATISPLTVVQGSNVILVCETNPTDPESTISWRQDGQLISQGVISATRQETRGVVTVSVWSQIVNWTDRGTYSCEALNTGLTRTAQDLTLSVRVPVSSVTLTNITSNNQLVPVNQDSSLVLTCQTSPAYPAATVTWYVRSSMTSSGVDSRTENQTSGQIVTVSTITRTMRKNNDQETFYCRAENINGEAGTQSKTARANVFYGPDDNKVNLTKPAVIAEGNNVTLTCRTLTPVNPEVDFTWSWGDNTAITAGLGSKQGTARWSWSQTLTVLAVRDSNRQEIRCDVINTLTSRSERIVVDLDVSYGPDSGEVQVSKSSTAVELEPLSLTCSTKDNVRPGVTFTWTVDGSEVTSGTGVTLGSPGGKWSQTLTLTPSRNQSSVGCTVINTAIARKESGSLDLDVNFPPDISLSPVEGPQNTDLTLTCTATGNPSNYRFEDFRQYWRDQPIQTRGGTQTGDRYSLDLPQVSYQDSGVYVCTVGNNVKEPSRKNTTVTVQASPKYTNDVNPTEPIGAEVGQTLRLVQNVYCSPNFTSVSWHFNTTHTTTSRLSTGSSSVSSSLVHLDVYGTQVEVAGFKLIYTVNKFKQEHVGFYTVRVCNIVGCAESSLKLIVSGPPETPLHFTALSSCTDSVTLTWTAQYAGGDYTQEFHVEFRVQNKSGDWSSRVFPPSQDNSGAWVVDGLDSNTVYVFRIKSVTDRKTGNNTSPLSTNIYVSTKEHPRQPNGNSSLGVGAGIGIGVGICLLVELVGVGVVLLLRRQGIWNMSRKKQKTETNTESREVAAAGNMSSQSTYEQLEVIGDSNNYEKLAHVYQNSVFEVASAQFNSRPAVSELNGAATLSWQIPAGGLGAGSSFYAVSPEGLVAFTLTSTGTFLALGNYTGRIEFSGNYTSRNITSTLRNISLADAGTYGCGNGGIDVISNCGQMLVVLGKPTKPPRPSLSTTPVYTKQVTLTCTSTSTSIPAGHGLTLTYTWERDGTIVIADTGTSFTFNVTSRDAQNYRCRGDESRGLSSDWSDVLQMTPEYGPYQETLTPPGLSYTVRENKTSVPSISCSANCNPACSYRWENNGTIISNSAVLNLGQSSRSQTGSYRCQAVNKHNSVFTSSVSVNVYCSPRLDTRKPLKTNVSSGLDEIASLLLDVVSNPAPTFRWYLSINQQLVPIPNITKHEVISTAKYSVLQIHVKNVRDYASYVVEATSNHDTFRMTFNLLPKSLKSQEVPSDRFGMGFGIGIASLLPLCVIGFILIVVYFKRRDSQMKKISDNRGTYSDLTPTPGNEYEELKVQRSEDLPGDYQNASND